MNGNRSSWRRILTSGMLAIAAIAAVLMIVRLIVPVHFAGTLSPANRSKLPLETIKLPPDFTISIYAEDLPNARSMTLSDSGTLFVGTRNAGSVYAVIDEDHDFRADRTITIARNMNMPNGVAFREGDLYVAEVSRVLVFRNIEKNLNEGAPYKIVSDRFPEDEHHGWKFIRFGPDGRLYVPVGAPCNVCRRDENRYAVIMRMNDDGSALEPYALGVRNTVGFDWHPRTGDLWFTDNGRDWMGDDQPPDELNSAPEKGMHFGFPFCHGGDIPDPEFGADRSCDDFVSPRLKLGAHVAALGMRFYAGSQFPEKYRGRIFTAEHGSWNRSTPVGYRITTVTLEGNRATEYSVFPEGWLQGERAWGRPVDVLVMPDGSLLVSDDRANAVYRIAYTYKNSSAGN